MVTHWKNRVTIFDKVIAVIRKEFASKLFKFLETKIKFYRNEAADFHNKEMPKIGSNQTTSAVSTNGSVFKKD